MFPRLRTTLPLLVLAVVFAAPPVRAYEATQGPSETLYWDPARAFEGYTLFAAHGRTYLIDMRGSVVHQWSMVGTNPKLLPGGHLLDASRNDPSGFGGFVEVDWSGRQVWTYNESRAGYAPHHDFIRIHNPRLNADTTMYLANRTVSSAEALAAGANPASGPYDGTGQADCVVEVDMSGTVIWQWCFIDHLVQDVSAAMPHYAGAGQTVAAVPGRLDANLPGRPIRRDWLHCNSLDFNEQLDQVVLNSVQGEFYVIDHGGTFVAGDPAASLAAAASARGDFLYRFGDPARYKQGDRPSIPDNWDTASSGHKQLGGAHDVHWIRPGLPGAGHFLIFNNGQYMQQLTNQSWAVEIAPYLDASRTDTGRYVNPPAAGYERVTYPRDTHKPPRWVSRQISWTYGTLSNVALFSQIGGSAQRLPNGNTLLCGDTEGHFVEVTATDPPEVVWEYINPVTTDGARHILRDALPMTNSVFRAYRYAATDPGLAGQVLTPQGTITGYPAYVVESGSMDAGTEGEDAAVDTMAPSDDVASDVPPPDAQCPVCPAATTCPRGGCRSAPGADVPTFPWMLALLGGVAALRRRRTRPTIS